MAMETQDIIKRSATNSITPPSQVRDYKAEVAKLIDVSTCIGCKACQVACSEWNDIRDEVGHCVGVYDNPADLSAKSWTVMRFSETEQNGKLEWLIRKDGCMHCEDPGCLKACPFGAMEETETLYKVYVGGRWGKKTRVGTPLNRLFTREEVLDVVERVRAESGMTVVMITHFPDEAARADRVIALDGGKVVIDAPAHRALSDVETLRAYGLDAPLPARIAYEMRKRGALLPDGIVTAEDLAEALCGKNI